MKSLINKIFSSDLLIRLRNTFKIKPIYISVNNLKNVSISDCFIWRTDNDFTTKFKFLDVLSLFINLN